MSETVEEVLCHLCCELMPESRLEEHLVDAHGDGREGSNQEHEEGMGEEDQRYGNGMNENDWEHAADMIRGDACGKSEQDKEAEVTGKGIDLEVSSVDKHFETPIQQQAKPQFSSGFSKVSGDEREYRCDKCTFATPFKHSLKSHMLTHTYDCASCPFKAVNKNLLLLHMQSNHSNQTGDWEVGGQGFVVQDDRTSGSEDSRRSTIGKIEDVEILLGYLGSDDEEQEMKNGEDFSYLAVAVVDNMAKVGARRHHSFTN